MIAFTKRVHCLYPGKPRLWRVFRRFLAAAAPIVFAITIPTAELHAEDTGPNPVAEIIAVEGRVEVRPPGGDQWFPVSPEQPPKLYPGYFLRPSSQGRAALKLPDGSIERIGGDTAIQFPAEQEPGSSILRMLKGVLFFFHRDERDQKIETRFASASIRGTEFVLRVDERQGLQLTLIEGRVDLENALGTASLTSGEQARVRPGSAPEKTAVLETAAELDWALYYPGVIDPGELPPILAQTEVLAAALDAYRRGNLPRAIQWYPWDRTATLTSIGELVFRAGVQLAGGDVEGAVTSLELLDRADAEPSQSESLTRVAAALRRLIDVVNFRPTPPAALQTPTLTTELLVETYRQQSLGDLDGALDYARRAAAQSPTFGFAHARVAELEFGFGRIAKAENALDDALETAPENAQAWVTRGFLAIATGDRKAAMTAFERAMALDAHLANARVGRGLLRIHSGDLGAGIEDLQTAAALEPNRSILRSYLGKAYAAAGRSDFAGREFDLAAELDESDPTARLYAALFHQQQNRSNRAVRELEESIDLNDNRRLYRSTLLLDQDQAVRGANLAGLYRDVGMRERSVSTAREALGSDYANYSAHLFLAHSYNNLRDRGGVNLRFESAAFGEYLMANLLAPAGAGTLGSEVSSGEYSRLFERDGFGVANRTEYRSNGDWVQSASQHGRHGPFAYALDLDYAGNHGGLPNQDNEILNLRARTKYQITRTDSVYFDLNYGEADGGDLRRVHSGAEIERTLRFSEDHAPNALIGYQRRWNPASQSLILLGALNSERTVRSTDARYGFPDFFTGNIVSVPVAMDYSIDFSGYIGNVQHILHHDRNTLVVGGRYQRGEYESGSTIDSGFPFLPKVVGRADESWERAGLYAYDTFEVLDGLFATAGVAYDNVLYPSRSLGVPVASGTDRVSRVSPKAGLVWKPTAKTSAYASYTRSLGGVGPEQSYRLEPTQVGGFNQAYRSLAPESLTGTASAARFELVGIGLDHAFRDDLYAGVQLQLARSEAATLQGFGGPVPSFVATRERFTERSATAYVNWLAGERFQLGATYQVAAADLTHHSPDQPAFEGRRRGSLHRLRLHSGFQHESGLFALFDAELFHQENRLGVVDETFWDLNARVGYRFAQRRAELSLAVLNLLDRDYRLNPVNFYRDIPRERLIAVTLRLNY